MTSTVPVRPRPEGDEVDEPSDGAAGGVSLAAMSVGMAERRRRLVSRLASPVATGALLVVTMAISTSIRLNGIRDWLWVDEGISVGISGHPIASIPHVLRKDGSPPLYYVVLHWWIGLFGTSEAALHALSLVFAIAVIPVSFWLARELFGLTAGWITAVLAATNPYLTLYGHEVRMYTLMVLLTTLACGFFMLSFVYRRRQYLPCFVLSSVATLYTHNWALWLVVSFAVVAAVCWRQSSERKMLARDSLWAFGAIGLLYLPWLPTLVYQSQHTAAPWSDKPLVREAVSAVGIVLGDERVLTALLLTAAVALVTLVLERAGQEALAAGGLLAIIIVTVGTAWLAAQVRPAWSTRYFGMFLPALLLAAGLGLAHERWRGALALVLIVLFWTHPLGYVTGLRKVDAVNTKSDVKNFISRLDLRPGDLVISAQMETVPVLYYYLPPGLRYATPMGPVVDPSTADWRDASARMARATPAANLAPVLAALPVGNRIFLFCPPDGTAGSMSLPWFAEIAAHCASWQRALAGDAGTIAPMGRPVAEGGQIVTEWRKVGAAGGG